PERSIRFLEGERRMVTMLNSDIAGFSSLTQRMDPQELVHFLNEYFARMIHVVLTHGGNIDKFQGDGMLVVFGAPNPMHDHAQQALKAAHEMVREIDRFNRDLVDARLSTISVGIGLDTGEVIAGHAGSSEPRQCLKTAPRRSLCELLKIGPNRIAEWSEAPREAAGR